MNDKDPFTASAAAEPVPPATGLERRIEKLEKINSALMARVERSMDQQANAFSLFQTAIGLEAQVKVRTEELKSALERLEIANDELVAARDAAERANRFKTRFFTAAGHDLLQPLHAARLSLSAMSAETGDPNQTKLIRQVDHALSSIDELLRTILDLSKLEAGVIKPAQQTVAVSSVFDTLRGGLEPVARAKGLTLTILPTDLSVRSDPLLLRRILQNLLANAVNYTEAGEVLLAARRRGAAVAIEVWDTGPGIEPAEQLRIFEEFQRGAASGRAAGGGFGLGLAIVQRSAEALGHAVTLCSRPGKGTCFRVSVPFVGRDLPARPAPAEQPARAVYGFGGKPVLIIDNDQQVLAAMRTLLQSWSCTVHAAASLRDIDALLASQPALAPEVILADYHLDNGEIGVDAVERVRTALGKPVPAIVITADHSPEVAAHVLGAGCEILKKPVRPAELRALILHVMR